jgi:DNA repair protein RecN (Recombination protein N)
MLKLLRINNIALVTSLEMEFGRGLTLLTGETGAGKSILIDALGLLLGNRAASELVRSGEERAVVEGVVEGKELSAFLQEHGLPLGEDEGEGEAILRREIQIEGKGRATVNGGLVPVSVLRELSPRIARIHGQHEPQGLLDPDTHLELLDRHAGLVPEAERVGELFGALRQAEAALESLRRGRQEGERRREMLEFQAAEIEKAHLAPGEEQTLRQEKVIQANADRLASLTSQAYALLYEDEAAVATRLGQAYRKVEELAGIDPRFSGHMQSRSALMAQVEDLALALRDYGASINVIPGRLDEIETRLALIDRLKKKYGETVEDVVAFAARCREELRDLSAPAERQAELEAKRTTAAREYFAAAGTLSSKRRAAAKDLEKKVAAALADLAMEKTRIKFRFDPDIPPTLPDDPSSWTERGIEAVELLLSPNPGEDLKPLARIASGGELSRILLALNSVASLDDEGKTLVFDEVDAGIGGGVAEVLGRKLKALSARHQVLCETHLPQVASFADTHYAVRKRVERGRTITEVVALGADERVEEVARMLGGETITETARRHAREMVKQGLRT